MCIRDRVYATESKIDPNTHYFSVRAHYPNTRGRLLPGRFVSVKIRMHDIPDAIAIPTQAVVPEMGDVYTRQVQQVLKRRAVQRPGVDMRVDVVIGRSAVKVGLAELPVLARGDPVVAGGLHQRGRKGSRVESLQHGLAILLQGDAPVGQGLIGLSLIHICSLT